MYFMESKEKINELEDELEYEFRPCGTMMMQRLMTKWTPEEREKFEQELYEDIEKALVQRDPNDDGPLFI